MNVFFKKNTRLALREQSESKGFTLVEMMISVTIISVVLSVVLWNQRSFSNNIDVANLAYKVALAVREAQVYGVSVRSSSGNYDQAYGVHFYLGNEESKKNMVIFADNDGDMKYTNGPSTNTCLEVQGTECVERITMNRGNLLSQICLVHSDDQSISCLPNDGSFTSVDVLFKRPNPDAIFVAYSDGGGAGDGVQALNAALFCVESPEGKQKEIAVYATGQISVNDGCSASTYTEEMKAGEEGAGDEAIGPDGLGGGR